MAVHNLLSSGYANMWYAVALLGGNHSRLLLKGVEILIGTRHGGHHSGPSALEGVPY